MKKIISLVFVAMVMAVNTFSQKEFTKMFELKIPVDVDKWGSNDDNSWVVAGDMSTICGIDAVSGKIVWTLVVKEKFGVKKAEKWWYDTDKGVVEVLVKGDKKDDQVTHYIDEKTGQEVSNPETRKKSSGGGLSVLDFGKHWVGAGNVRVPELNSVLHLSYERNWAVSSFKRGKTYPIEVMSTGDHSWKTQIQGSFVRSLCDNVRGYGSDFGGDFITLFYEGGYVFVVYEGLSVLDAKTGALLWETTFDYSIFDFGAIKSELILGRAPMPVVDGTSVYVADLSKDVRAIKKFDAATGKVLWSSERLEKDAIITEMIVENGALIVRNGGEVLVQSLIQNANTGAQTCISEYKEEGDFSLTAYDVASGKLLWEGKELKSLGDKFKSISNLMGENGILYVASDRNLFALEPKTGEIKFKTDLAALKIGKAKTLYFLNGDILISGEEGLARASKGDGKIKYGTNTDKNFGFMEEGEAFYVWNGSKDDDIHQFIRFNLETGAIEGMIRDTYHPYFSPDGNQFIRMSKGVLSRYNTKK
ncbi:MAG: PQQ-binding-like beta-propeller repeat protein [Flavobacteriales bacterium]